MTIKVENKGLVLITKLYKSKFGDVKHTISILDALTALNEKRVKDIIRHKYVDMGDEVIKAFIYKKEDNIDHYNIWIMPKESYEFSQSERTQRLFKKLDKRGSSMTSESLTQGLRGKKIARLVYNKKDDTVVLRSIEGPLNNWYSIEHMIKIALSSSMISSKEKKDLQRKLQDACVKDNISENDIQYMESNKYAILNYLIAQLTYDNLSYNQYIIPKVYEFGDMTNSFDVWKYKELMSLLNTNLYSFISMDLKDIVDAIVAGANNDVFTDSNVNIVMRDSVSDVLNSDVYKEEISDILSISANEVIKMQQNVINALKEPINYAILTLLEENPNAQNVSISVKFKDGTSVVKKRAHIEKTLRNIKYVLEDSVDKYQPDAFNYNIEEMNVSYGKDTVTLNDYIVSLKNMGIITSSKLLYLNKDNKDYIKSLLKDNYVILERYNNAIMHLSNKKKENFILQSVFLTKRSLSDNKVTITEDEYFDIVTYLISLDRGYFYLGYNNYSNFRYNKKNISRKLFEYEVTKRIFDLYDLSESDIDIFNRIININLDFSFHHLYSMEKEDLIRNITKAFVKTTKSNHFSLSETNEILFFG